ncbi:hypothetical protein [Planktothricoides raciborskii]|uniref:Uncharacterized protein n=1 Tax=Planktothricoides raciborskii FACHB-1370 TaxID=2949576 RepID=A0ABR8EEZ6_9CYAN|nr:hypothetical protein [Planktothricoides raciborskii]MBD2545258.1 hypothetical protein [Planktothricoides raciborskii FACHB-1370]
MTGCWGKETGFLGWVSGVICGLRERNPVSEVLGLAVGAKKPGFWGGYQELSVGCGKETRFLGFWGWLLG